jgi:hypothetical protein
MSQSIIDLILFYYITLMFYIYISKGDKEKALLLKSNTNQSLIN